MGGRGGRGNSGDQRLRLLELLVAEERKRCGNGQGDGRGGAQRGSRRPNQQGGGAGGGGGSRSGDVGATVDGWKCRACGAAPVWNSRSACFRCGAPRDGGRRGASPAPTYRKPGSSLAAARSSSPTAAARSHHSVGPPNACGTARSNTSWTEVASRPLRGSKGTGGSPSPPSAAASSPASSSPASSSSPPSAPPSRSTPAGAAPPAGGAQATAAAVPPAAARPSWADQSEDREDDDCDDGDGADELEKLRVLKEGAWRSLRQLKARNANTPEFVLEAVREKAEAAEAKWRAAKPSTPLALRHTRALAKLDKAIKLQHRNQRELDDFEADVLAKRGRLEKRAIDDKARVDLHQRTLDGLRREMEGGTGNGNNITISADESAAMAVAGLDGVVPALQSILDALPADFKLRELLEKAQDDAKGVAAMLKNCRAPHPQGGETENYDLAEHDDGDYGEDDEFDGMEDEDSGDLGDEWADQAWPSAAQAQRGAGATRWRQTSGRSWGDGTWQRTPVQQTAGQQQDGDLRPSPALSSSPPPPSSPPLASVSALPASAPLAPPTPAADPPAATAHREQIGLDGEQRMALAANLNPEDQARAMAQHALTTAMEEQQQQMHQQQQQVQQQQAKARAHDAAVRDTVQRAKAMGVSVDQEWLQSLSTQDLGAWVYSNLG